MKVTEVTRFRSRGKESWLGVADPCGYLNALVGMANLLGMNLLASKKKFVAFRLAHPYILKGKPKTTEMFCPLLRIAAAGSPSPSSNVDMHP